MHPVICMVAPNGARRSKSDHKQLPVTADELAHTAESITAAGATALHLHVRDAEGKHSLSIERYRKAIHAIRNRCGEHLLLQVTTESVGVYSVEQQMDLVYQLQPQAVSLSVRELARADQKAITALDSWMRDCHVLPQWILYSDDDLRQYQHWLRENVLCGRAYPVLIVLGNYSQQVNGDISMLQPFLTSTSLFSSWMVCVFGYSEQEVMKKVVTKGGHMRVGFENNLYRSDKTPVNDNAELVKTSVASVHEAGLSMATVEQTCQQLQPDW